MDLNKKNRSELKKYFESGSIPTDEHFKDFIDANLNQAEDGIAKVQGSPIALQAEGDSSGTQEVLNFFTSFRDANPNWSINLNPRVVPNEPGSNKPGLNFKNAAGASQLFIRSIGGNVGIGTIEPASRLSIQARESASLISVISETTGTANIFEVSQENNNGELSIRSRNGLLISKLSGSPSKPSFFLSNVGLGTETPEANLHIQGDGAILKISNTQTGESPTLNIQSSNNKSWNIYSDESSGNFFTIKASEPGEKGITIKRDGTLTAMGGVIFGERPAHANQDGAMYKLGGKLYLAIDDDFFIRDVGGKEKLHVSSNSGRIAIGGSSPEAPLSITGAGKEDSPDGKMHITPGCILFGGNNKVGLNKNSAQISVGKHEPNSLNIIGMSSGSESTDRKVDIWAEGGMMVRGHIKTQSKYIVAFCVTLSVNNQSGNRNPVVFGHVEYNFGDHFKSNTHFIAPITGMYMFSLIMRNNTETDVAWMLRLNDTGYVNGASGDEIGERTYVRSRESNHTASRTIITKLNQGDKVHVEQHGGGNDNYSSGFEGFLLQAFE